MLVYHIFLMKSRSVSIFDFFLKLSYSIAIAINIFSSCYYFYYSQDHHLIIFIIILLLLFSRSCFHPKAIIIFSSYYYYAQDRVLISVFRFLFLLFLLLYRAGWLLRCSMSRSFCNLELSNLAANKRRGRENTRCDRERKTSSKEPTFHSCSREQSCNVHFFYRHHSSLYLYV